MPRSAVFREDSRLQLLFLLLCSLFRERMTVPPEKPSPEPENPIGSLDYLKKFYARWEHLKIRSALLCLISHYTSFI